MLLADLRAEYNTYRPHCALGMLTPAEFAARWDFEPAMSGTPHTTLALSSPQKAT